MAEESSKALVKRSTENQLELMPPPPKRIKRPQKVIDEDSYTDAISHIIQRDFFPGLAELEAHQDYLDALESRNSTWIASAGEHLKETMTPGRNVGRRGTSLHTYSGTFDTPTGYAGNTPASVRSDTSMLSTQSKATTIDTNMSLDQFQSKYTSEDNESFYKLLDKQNEKRAEKHAWMWNGNQLPSNRQLAQGKVEEKLLKAGESLVDNGGERKRLAIRDVDEKPAMPDGWQSKPDNNLMFRPSGIEDTLQTVAQKAQADSKAAPKAVLYGNTRLPPAELSQDANVPPSPSLSAVRDAIAGRRRAGYSESSIEQNGEETPKVNGYAFVDDEPDDDLPEIHHSSGSITLGKGDATPNPFKIKEQSKREDILHRLVDRASKSKRESSSLGLTGKADATPVPRFPSSPRVNSGGLTPAAQRLWSKVGNSRPKGSPNAFQLRTPGTAKKESSLKIRWTPKSQSGS